MHGIVNFDNVCKGHESDGNMPKLDQYITLYKCVYIYECVCMYVYVCFRERNIKTKQSKWYLLVTTMEIDFNVVANLVEITRWDEFGPTPQGSVS